MKLPKFSLSKADKKKYRLLFLSAILLSFTTAIITSAPSIVTLAESKVISSANESLEKPKYLINDQVQAKKSWIEIVDQKIPSPQFTSGSVLAFDLDNNRILYEKNSNNRMSPASTTKIMTALVAMEHYQTGDILVVPAEALVGGSSMGLTPGERLTFRSLLYGMLLNSGNDAAYTLAMNYPDGFSAFVARMNQKASELGLKNTSFENPAGFDGANHYSSAQDLAKIAKEAIKNPQLAKIFSTKEASVISYDQSKSHPLKNLNKLLGEDGITGIKTGFTEKSGENLVGLVERNGHMVLTVVLSSSDRFGETKNLIDWIYQNFTWNLRSN